MHTREDPKKKEKNEGKACSKKGERIQPRGGDRGRGETFANKEKLKPEYEKNLSLKQKGWVGSGKREDFKAREGGGEGP